MSTRQADGQRGSKGEEGVSERKTEREREETTSTEEEKQNARGREWRDEER